MERRLGKGLSSLLGSSSDVGLTRWVEIENIDPNPFQPRKTMDPAGLEELRDSIAIHGILQPVVLRAQGDRYQLVSGERRWRAARLAGLDQVPAVIRENVSDADMLELALVENVQRRDLDPLERARGFKALMDTLSITQEGVAMKVGLKRATVANHLRLLDLPVRVQEAVGKGLLSMGHARALLGLRQPEHMESLMEKCVRHDLSVRDVERIVREELAGNRPPSADGGDKDDPAWQRQAERRLQDVLATKVRIDSDASFRGEIRLAFYSKQDLDRLLDVLAPRARLA